jgi:hypothetical protein
MSTTKSTIGKLQVTIVKELPDLSKDPTIIKRAEEAKEFLKKYGMPESFKKKK